MKGPPSKSVKTKKKQQIITEMASADTETAEQSSMTDTKIQIQAEGAAEINTTISEAITQENPLEFVCSIRLREGVFRFRTYARRGDV
jgi:hypothetical protein